MQYNTETLVACTELIKVNKKLSCELLFVWWFCLFLNGDGRKTLVFISLFPCFFALKQGQKEEHKVCIEIWVLGPVSTPITDLDYPNRYFSRLFLEITEVDPITSLLWSSLRLKRAYPLSIQPEYSLSHQTKPILSGSEDN